MTWAHDIWCSRCNFIHKANKTHLDELRVVLFEKCHQYYNDPQHRHEVGRCGYILKRFRSFFSHGSEIALTLWNNQLSQALQDTIKEAKIQPRIDSIFTPVSRPLHPPHPRIRKRNVNLKFLMQKSNAFPKLRRMNGQLGYIAQSLIISRTKRFGCVCFLPTS